MAQETEKYSVIIALIALIISIASSIFYLFGYLKGAKIEFFPPEEVLLIVYNFEDPNENYVRIGSRMAYTNDGHPSYNAIIKKESASIQIDNIPRIQVWQAFREWDAQGTKLISHKNKSASPFTVNARSAVSHDTYFTPVPILCFEENCDPAINYIKLSEFINDFKKTKGDYNYSIYKFTFQAEIYGKEPLTEKRIAIITEEDMKYMENNGWIVVTCYEEKIAKQLRANKR